MGEQATEAVQEPTLATPTAQEPTGGTTEGIESTEATPAGAEVTATEGTEESGAQVSEDDASKGEGDQGADELPNGVVKEDDGSYRISGKKVGADGVEADIVVPQDQVEMLESAGLNAHEIAGELWEGEFGFSEETQAKLEEAFGKTQVSLALQGLKASHDQMQGDIQRAITEQQQADEARAAEALEMVGGEENWHKMEQYAIQNFSDADIQAFNDVMTNGSTYMQNLAIKDLASRMDEGVLHLVDSDTSDKGDSGVLSAAAYQELFVTGEYHKASPEDRTKFDNMRERGRARGV